MDRQCLDDIVHVTSPSDWSFLPLRDIDGLLRCPICFEYYKTAMILPCSHSYCSLCIRRYIKVKSACPTCGKATGDSDLINNIILDNLTISFTKHRNAFKQLLKSSDKLSSNSHSTCTFSQCISTSQQSQSTTSQQSQSQSTSQQFQSTPLVQSTDASAAGTYVIPLSDDDDSDEPASPSLLSPNPHKKCKVGESSTSIASAHDVSGTTDISKTSFLPSTPVSGDDNTTVECPVCGIQLLTQHINNHLDICLGYDTSRSKASHESDGRHKLPRLPKLCYNIMRDSQLKSKLKEYYLPTHGSRKEMISRLQEFTLQYNSQCDSQSPKTIKEVAHQVQALETMQQEPSRRVVKVKVNKSSDEEEIKKEQTKYINHHKAQFDQLIHDVKARSSGIYKSAASLEEYNDENDPDFEPYIPCRKRKRK